MSCARPQRRFLSRQWRVSRTPSPPSGVEARKPAGAASFFGGAACASSRALLARLELADEHLDRVDGALLLQTVLRGGVNVKGLTPSGSLSTSAREARRQRRRQGRVLHGVRLHICVLDNSLFLLAKALFSLSDPQNRTGFAWRTCAEESVRRACQDTVVRSGDQLALRRRRVCGQAKTKNTNSPQAQHRDSYTCIVIPQEAPSQNAPPRPEQRRDALVADRVSTMRDEDPPTSACIWTRVFAVHGCVATPAPRRQACVL